MSAQEIHEQLGGVWGKDCPKHKTINTWRRDFRRTRTNTYREPIVRENQVWRIFTLGKA